MKLRIDLQWHGLRADDRPSPPPEPCYFPYVQDSQGWREAGPMFNDCVALEAYLARHYPSCEREALPPAPPQEAAHLERALALIDQAEEKGFDPQYLRSMLAGMLYQWSHRPETVERLRRELGLPPAPAL